jgi:hypothetical protein
MGLGIIFVSKYIYTCRQCMLTSEVGNQYNLDTSLQVFNCIRLYEDFLLLSYLCTNGTVPH